MSGVTSALASLTATYTDSEDEDTTQEEEEKEQPQQQLDQDSRSNPASPAAAAQAPSIPASKDAGASVVGNDVLKNSSASGLVSYILDDQIDDDAVDDYQSDSVSEKEEGEPKSKVVTSGDDDSKSPEAAGAVKEVLEEEEEKMEVEEIDSRKGKLPPEPTGQVRPELQERVAALYAKKVKTGLDMNFYIQQNKQFRNPSIYEKLIMLCNIDELGTNYPPDVYNPHSWAESSFYDELAKAQKADMERREKEKKERTKVEFISGTAVKKPTAAVPPAGAAAVTAAGLAAAAAMRAASKWDQRGAVANLPLNFPTQQPILVQPNLATAATGTKTTVINAFGNLPKKSKQ